MKFFETAVNSSRGSINIRDFLSIVQEIKSLPEAIKGLRNSVVIRHLAVMLQKHKPIDHIVSEYLQFTVRLIPLFIFIIFLNISAMGLIVIIDVLK